MFKYNLKQVKPLCQYCDLCVRVGVVRNLHNSSKSPGSVSSVYELNTNLNGLTKSGKVDDARRLFDTMSTRDEFTWNTMIAAYANSGRFSEALRLFDQAPSKSSITWSSLISGYSRNGFENEAMQLFWRMQYECCAPSMFTLASLLAMCASKGLVSRGEQIHAHAIKTQFDANGYVNTGLVDMYAKCSCILEAQCLFDAASYRKSHVLWTAMITGYSQNNDGAKAMKCFRDMLTEGVDANQYTFPSVLTACAAVSAHKFGEQVHGHIIQTGFEANVYVQSALVDMYAKCRDLKSARIALETMEVDDVVSWNSMIVGCVRQRSEEEALSLFKKMHGRGLGIDDYTYPSVLNSCAALKDVEHAKSVHCSILKNGFEAYKLVSNALVDMYAKGGDTRSAFKVFDGMIDRDVISWTSLVTGFAQNGSHEQAINLFCKMRLSGISADQIVTASVLSACAELTILEFGQQVHASFMKSGLRSTLSVDNSLVAMYAKCGCIEDANKVFDSMRVRDVITWTALIVGYAQNGRGKDSIALYERMIESGTRPDFITFIGLLFACSHTGLLERGRHYFASMDRDYGIKPGADHYACMIDLLGRSGKMDEAKELLNEMDVEPDATVWKVLLGACRVHGNVELAERAAKALFELEPQNGMPYVMLSNIYSAAGLWNSSAEVRKLMKTRGVNKEPGRSWIELNSKVHTFMSEDRSHPRTDQIYSKVGEIMTRIKEAGYVPDMSFALHDVDEEVKELGLAYHGEKLAVAFGLLFVPEGAPIRIYKNLRVCGDCHSAMKFISKVFNRHIILRDSNCFHHFKEGKCSCGDYW